MERLWAAGVKARSAAAAEPAILSLGEEKDEPCFTVRSCMCSFSAAACVYVCANSVEPRWHNSWFSPGGPCSVAAAPTATFSPCWAWVASPRSLESAEATVGMEREGERERGNPRSKSRLKRGTLSDLGSCLKTLQVLLVLLKSYK